MRIEAIGMLGGSYSAAVDYKIRRKIRIFELAAALPLCIFLPANRSVLFIRQPSGLSLE